MELLGSLAPAETGRRGTVVEMPISGNAYVDMEGEDEIVVVPERELPCLFPLLYCP